MFTVTLTGTGRCQPGVPGSFPAFGASRRARIGYSLKPGLMRRHTGNQYMTVSVWQRESIVTGGRRL
eukprot:1786282-Alexandrium_andersonii.AAC.1